MTEKYETNQSVVLKAVIIAFGIMIGLVLIMGIANLITSSNVIMYQSKAKVPYSFNVGSCGRFNIIEFKCTESRIEFSLGDLPCSIDPSTTKDLVNTPFGTITETVTVYKNSTQSQYDQKELHKILGEICAQAHRGTLASYIRTGANEYKPTGK